MLFNSNFSFIVINFGSFFFNPPPKNGVIPKFVKLLFPKLWYRVLRSTSCSWLHSQYYLNVLSCILLSPPHENDIGCVKKGYFYCIFLEMAIIAPTLCHLGQNTLKIARFDAFNIIFMGWRHQNTTQNIQIILEM